MIAIGWACSHDVRKCPLNLIVDRRLDVGGAVAEESRGGDGLRKYDADGHEDGPGPWCERNGHLEPRALRILIAAAKTDSAFGQIFANCDFFLESALADARQHACFYARAVPPGDDAIRLGRLGGKHLRRLNFRM